MDTRPKRNNIVPKIPINIVTDNAPESVKFPEVVAGILGFFVGVGVIVADTVAAGVIVADGVATNAGNPPTLSDASTVKLLTTFWKTLFASVYSKVTV